MSTQPANPQMKIAPDGYSTTHYCTSSVWDFDALSVSQQCFSTSTVAGNQATTSSSAVYFDAGINFVMQNVAVQSLPVGGSSSCWSPFNMDEWSNTSGDRAMINSDGGSDCDCKPGTCITYLQYASNVGSVCSLFQPTFLASPDSAEATTFTFVRYQYPDCAIPTVLLYAHQYGVDGRCLFTNVANNLAGFVYFKQGSLACDTGGVVVPPNTCVPGQNDGVSYTKCMVIGTLEEVTALRVQFAVVPAASGSGGAGGMLVVYRDGTDPEPRPLSIIPIGQQFYSNIGVYQKNWPDGNAVEYVNNYFNGNETSSNGDNGWANASFTGLYPDENFSFTNTKQGSSLLGQNVYTADGVTMPAYAGYTRLYQSLLWNLVMQTSNPVAFPPPAALGGASGFRSIVNQTPDAISLQWSPPPQSGTWGPTPFPYAGYPDAYVATVQGNGGISTTVQAGQTGTLNYKITGPDPSVTIAQSGTSFYSNGFPFSFCQSRRLEPGVLLSNLSFEDKVSLSDSYPAPPVPATISKTIYFNASIPGSRCYGVIDDSTDPSECVIGIQTVCLALTNQTKNALTFILPSGATAALNAAGVIAVPLENSSISYYILDDADTKYQMSWALSAAGDSVALNTSNAPGFCPFMGCTANGMQWTGTAASFTVTFNFDLFFFGRPYNFDSNLLLMLLTRPANNFNPIIKGATILDYNGAVICAPNKPYQVPSTGLTGAQIMEGTIALHTLTLTA